MAGNKDLTIDKGATFKISFTWSTKDQQNVKTPVDLTGFSAESQMRESYESTSPLATMSSGAGTIVLGGAAGTIELIIPAATTSAIVPDRGVWDLELTNPSGEVIKLLSGRVTFKPEVTK